MQHVKLSVFVEPALVVLIKTLVGVLYSGEIRDTPVNGLQKIRHREVSTVERRNVIIVERQPGRSGGDGLAVPDKFLDPADLWERRGHRTDTPSACGSGVGRQSLTFAKAAAPYVDNHLEPLRNRSHPFLSKHDALVRGEHVPFSGGAVDEHSFQAVPGQHGGIGRYGLRVDIAVPEHWRERSVNQSFYLLHK